MKTKLITGLIVLVGSTPGRSQAQFPWPVTPFHESQQITGNFAEFRDTGSADHFHNGTDIPKPDGSPVYPVKDGVVTSIGAVSSLGIQFLVRRRFPQQPVGRGSALEDMFLRVLHLEPVGAAERLDQGLQFGVGFGFLERLGKGDNGDFFFADEDFSYPLGPHGRDPGKDAPGHEQEQVTL